MRRVTVAKAPTLVLPVAVSRRPLFVQLDADHSLRRLAFCRSLHQAAGSWSGSYRQPDCKAANDMGRSECEAFKPRRDSTARPGGQGWGRLSVRELGRADVHHLAAPGGLAACLPRLPLGLGCPSAAWLPELPSAAPTGSRGGAPRGALQLHAIPHIERPDGHE